MSTNEELYGKLDPDLDEDGDTGSRAMKLAELAGILSHKNRTEVILRLLKFDSLPASQAWPSSVTPANRWRHLKPMRSLLKIERYGQKNEALYRLDIDTKRRLQQVVDSLETLAADSLDDDASATRTNPTTIRLSFEDDDVCIIQTPEEVIQVERSKLLGTLALVLESIP